MKKTTFALLSLLLLFSCARPIPVPEEDASRAVSGHLSSGQVNAFAEDAHGQIWMATSRGLNRFDGKSFHQFFRRYKLNKAAGLLLEGKFNISEVADHTGFSSLSYFSSCFKKQFGVPPSEYKG